MIHSDTKKLISYDMSPHFLSYTKSMSNSTIHNRVMSSEMFTILSIETQIQGIYHVSYIVTTQTKIKSKTI